MGHLINPISFRLGYTRNWSFSGALMESKSQYFYLNSKYWNILLLFKRIFSLQIFEKMGIMFSHLRFLNSPKKDALIIYLYDGPLQNEAFIFFKYLNKHSKLKRSLKYGKKFFRKFFYRVFFSFYYLKTLYLILEMFNKFIVNFIKKILFKICQLIAFLKNELKFIDNFYYFLKTTQNHQINAQLQLNNFIMNFLFKKQLNNMLINCFYIDYYVNSIFYEFYFSNNVNNILDKLEIVIKNVLNLIIKFDNYNIQVFINLYKKFYNNYKILSIIKFGNSIKHIYLKDLIKEYFYEINKINEFKFVNLIFGKSNTLLIKFVNSIINCSFFQRLNYYKFCEKLLYSFGRKKKKKFIFLNFFFRFFVFMSNNFFIFLKNLIFTLKPFFENSFLNNLSIYFKNVSKKQITAALITQYICIRLRQKFSLKEVLRPILKDLTNNPTIRGFRLSCCGRFTKKEIATYKWERRGKIPLNTINANIDYSYNFVILKYSACGIKVWLHRNNTYKYFLKKWFENLKFFEEKKKFFKKQNLNKIKKKKNYTRRYAKKITNYVGQKRLKIINYKLLKIYKKINSLTLKKNISIFVKNLN